MNNIKVSDDLSLQIKNLRKRVSVIVVHKGQILGFHAQDPHNKKKYVFLPGGKIEENEPVEMTAIRETKEETGYTIKIDPHFRHFERYDFEWDGKINDCQTWFLRGTLDPLEQTPSTVNDASYHQGVAWILLQEAPSAFGCHDAILRAMAYLQVMLNSVQDV